MTGDVRELVNARNTPPCVVGFADGGTSTSIQMGDMILTESISLKDVLFVPNLDCTLISVSKLLKHSNSLRYSPIRFVFCRTVLRRL